MDFCLVAAKPQDETFKDFYLHNIDEADLLFDVVFNATGIEVPVWPNLSEYECSFLAFTMRFTLEVDLPELQRCISHFVAGYYDDYDQTGPYDLKETEQYFMEKYEKLQAFLRIVADAVACNGFRLKETKITNK